MAFPANKPHSLTLSSITHSFILIHSLIYSALSPLIHSLTHALIHIHSFHSLIHIHSHSFTHSLIQQISQMQTVPSSALGAGT